MPQVTLYGKTGCQKCDAAKQKLSIMDIPYTFFDLANLRDCYERRFDGSTDGMAEYERRDASDLPLMLIDGKWFGYSDGIAYLKKGRE